MFTADDARKFLARIFEDQDTEEDLRETYIYWALQGEIMTGEHSEELATLNMRRHVAHAAGNEALSKELTAKRDAIEQRILQEIEQELAELEKDGKEMPWAKWRK